MWIKEIQTFTWKSEMKCGFFLPKWNKFNYKEHLMNTTENEIDMILVPVLN